MNWSPLRESMEYARASRWLVLVLAMVSLLGFARVLPAAEIRTMGVEQAREATRSNHMILVDIRTPKEWRASGIPDVAVPLDMTQKGFVRELMALREQHPGRQLGLICATGGRSRYLATWLMQRGIDGVIDVPAGMHTREGWLAKQLPVRAAK